MDELLKQASESAGLNEKEGKESIGGILSLLKSTVSEQDFSKIAEALPGANQLVEESNKTRAGEGSGASSSAASGLMSSAMNMLGGSSGGGTTGEGSTATGGQAAGTQGTATTDIQNLPQLLAFMSSLGISQKQIMAFLPAVVKFLQQNAGIDASSALGVSGGSGTTAAGTSSSASAGGTAGGSLVEQAQSFLSGGSGTAGTTSGTTSSGTTGEGTGGNSLMNQAQGFLSSFGKK